MQNPLSSQFWGELPFWIFISFVLRRFFMVFFNHSFSAVNYGRVLKIPAPTLGSKWGVIRGGTVEAGTYDS